MTTLPQTQGKTIPDAWDYKGRPAERFRTGGWTAAAMILGPPPLRCPLLLSQYIHTYICIFIYYI